VSLSRWAWPFRHSAPLRDITLKECVFDDVENENVIQNVTDLRVSDVTINGKNW
jgi:hypothetical protein